MPGDLAREKHGRLPSLKSPHMTGVAGGILSYARRSN